MTIHELSRTVRNHAAHFRTPADLTNSFIVGGWSTGISSAPSKPLTNWLAANGHPIHYAKVNVDFSFSFLKCTERKTLYGGELSFSGSVFNGEPQAFSGRVGATIGKLLYNDSKKKIAACMTVGFGTYEFDFTKDTFTTFAQTPKDFEIGTSYLYLSPTIRWYVPLGKKGFGSDIDFGMRIYPIQGSWAYRDDNTNHITVDGVPRLPKVEFFVSIPLLIFLQHGLEGSNPFRLRKKYY